MKIVEELFCDPGYNEGKAIDHHFVEDISTFWKNKKGMCNIAFPH